MTAGQQSEAAERVLAFTKMEGAGNDYVYVDAIHGSFDEDVAGELARQVAHRRFGVGGDGLIVLAPSSRADVAMWMWNADGSRGSMCGNGVRCLAKLAHDVGAASGPAMTVETDCGVKHVELLFTGAEVTGAKVEMGAIEVATVAETLHVDGQVWSFYPADAGNPQAVLFVDDDPERVPVQAVGAAMQDLPRFPTGVNACFVQVSDGGLQQRTFERGSGETWACGSGATAAACAAVRLGHLSGPEVRVSLRGGDLRIHCSADGTAVMSGPARAVFRGEIELPPRK